MSDVAVYVAVRKQSDKVHCAAVFHAVVFELLPCGRIENVAAFDCFFNKLCALRIDLTATECVVSHFAVAHIVVAGKSHRRAVCLDIGVGALFQKCVESGCVCKSYGIAKPGFRLAYTVHYNQNKFFHIVVLFVVCLKILYG